MFRLLAIVATIAGIGWAVLNGYGFVASHHWFAPGDPYPCQKPDHTTWQWYKDSHYRWRPGTIHWMGYTEVAGCSMSLKITIGTK